MRADRNQCTACHPPHTGAGAALPWNRNPATIRFQWGDATATSGGTRLPTNIATWAGSTRVCLSCHDGTIDMRSFGTMRSSAHEMFGGDAAGNHPVAIPYPYNDMRNTYNGITTGDGALRSGWVAEPRGVKLFQDPSGAAPNNRGIECATCHDPHGTDNAKFLRVAAATICSRCHAK